MLKRGGPNWLERHYDLEFSTGRGCCGHSDSGHLPQFVVAY